jgi:hypothetical protein
MYKVPLIHAIPLPATSPSVHLSVGAGRQHIGSLIYTHSLAHYKSTHLVAAVRCWVHGRVAVVCYICTYRLTGGAWAGCSACMLYIPPHRWCVPPGVECMIHESSLIRFVIIDLRSMYSMHCQLKTHSAFCVIVCILISCVQTCSHLALVKSI